MEDYTISMSTVAQDSATVLSQKRQPLVTGLIITTTIMTVATALATILNWHLVKPAISILYNAAACQLQFECLLTSVLPQVITLLHNSLYESNVMVTSLITLVLLAHYLWLGLTRYITAICTDGTAPIIYLFPSPWRAIKSLIATVVYLIMLLFVIPGIYWATRFTFFNSAIAHDNAGMLSSFTTSWAMTKNQSWLTTIMHCILTVVIVVAHGVTLGLIITMPIIIALTSLVPYSILIIMINLIGSIVIGLLVRIPCTMVAHACAYRQLTLKKSF
ncbi:MAG: hypothetical protein NTX86_01085 [Candidatus Dependentiae bacterium]|nr:hypothetical protein [Candidatus Dependentiae bacterium]